MLAIEVKLEEMCSALKILRRMGMTEDQLQGQFDLALDDLDEQVEAGACRHNDIDPRTGELI